MTWVIGCSSIFGYGAMLSDVCITFSDGSRHDLLQKAYPVGQYLLGGFAGSVVIGFSLLSNISKFLMMPSGTPTNLAWQPEWVAENWKKHAKMVFESAPLNEKELGSQFILVGVSPDEDLGAAAFPRVYVIKFSWPNFEPTYSRKGLSVDYIGSGASVKNYCSAIQSFFDIKSPSLQAAVSGPETWIGMIGFSMAQVIQETPIDGISPHLLIHLCKRGGIASTTNDFRRLPNDDEDEEPIEFKMPPIARNYKEFVKLCKNLNINEALAVA